MFEIANGLAAFRMSIDKQNYTEYLGALTVEVGTDDSMGARTNAFAEMIALEVLARGGEEKERNYDSKTLDKYISRIDSKLTGTERVKTLVDYLGRAIDKSAIRKVLNSKDIISRNERKSIQVLVIKNAIDRISKTLWVYCQQKKNEALGIEPPTKSATKSREVLAGNIRYQTIGVQVLDEAYCHRDVLNVLEDFCKKKMDAKNTHKWIKKKDPHVRLNLESVKELFTDLGEIEKNALNEAVYDEDTNEFIPANPDLRAVCTKFLIGGSHKLSDSALIELIPSCFQQAHYKPGVQEEKLVNIGLNTVLCHSARRGPKVALKVWRGSSQKDKMRSKVVEQSMQRFMKAKKAFDPDLKKNAGNRASAQVALSADKISKGKRGKGKAEFLNAVVQDFQNQEREEQRAKKAEEDKFYEKTMPAPRGGASSEDGKSHQNMQVVPFEPDQDNFLQRMVEKSGNEASLKKSKPAGKDIGIKELDDRFITKDLVQGVRHFINVFYDFQPTGKKKYAK